MPDSNLKLPQATNEDYRGSGWSRGHMARHQDMKWSVQAALESDYYTNICPQDAKMNNGLWKKIENKARKIALNYDSVNIVCGPIFVDTAYGTLGSNKVPIPDYFFKTFLIYTNGEYHSIAFLCPNNDDKRAIDQFALTVNEIEKLTGLDLYPHLDDSPEEDIEDFLEYEVWFY